MRGKIQSPDLTYNLSGLRAINLKGPFTIYDPNNYIKILESTETDSEDIPLFHILSKGTDVSGVTITDLSSIDDLSGAKFEGTTFQNLHFSGQTIQTQILPMLFSIT